MRASRLLPPLLAAATILMAASNVVPATARRHALSERRQELLMRLADEQDRARRLEEEIAALRQDPFVLQRVVLETWNLAPPGALPAPLTVLTSE